MMPRAFCAKHRKIGITNSSNSCQTPARMPVEKIASREVNQHGLRLAEFANRRLDHVRAWWFVKHPTLRLPANAQQSDTENHSVHHRKGRTRMNDQPASDSGSHDHVHQQQLVQLITYRRTSADETATNRISAGHYRWRFLQPLCISVVLGTRLVHGFHEQPVPWS